MAACSIDLVHQAKAAFLGVPPGEAKESGLQIEIVAEHGEYRDLCDYCHVILGPRREMAPAGRIETGADLKCRPGVVSKLQQIFENAKIASVSSSRSISYSKTVLDFKAGQIAFCPRG